MKSVVYYYNNVEGEEELHENEEAAKLLVGAMIERVGTYWKITRVQTEIAVAISSLSMSCRSISKGRSIDSLRRRDTLGIVLTNL